MKSIVGIFAHPDDEALGPSGTIALLAKEYDVYLICATNGDAANGKPDPQLGEKRKRELEASGAILGVKKVFFLNYGDGMLSNSVYHAVAKDIEKILSQLKPEQIITIEPRGISGHIDHIFISMVSSFVFENLSYVKEIWYHCISKRFRSFMKKYFIYFPPGYDKTEVDEVVDVSSVWSIKRRAMMQHKSQMKDALGMLAVESILPKEEYFLVRKK
jgi:N-acetylglucosamine malate deacetylase 2